MVYIVVTIIGGELVLWRKRRSSDYFYLWLLPPIFAIAVLWGLAEMSGHRMPMIIDTPLAKLDSRHVKSIATKFFPAASHQVILLSQDREIDQSIYNALKSRIDHSFTISLGEQNKVKEGYFFE